MDWDSKQDLTMDFAVHSHEDDRTTAVITQLVELANLISNHLGSNIDPNEKPTTPSQKKGKEVDVVRLTAKPVVQTISKGFVPNRRVASKDFTGRSISKEDIDDVVEEDMTEFNREKIAPMVAAGAALLSDTEKKADPMTTSEGKALLASLQEAANKLRKYLMTTRVSASSAQKPSDMR